MSEKTLELFHKIELRHPSDIIIQQIQELISEGILTSGTKLPSERELSQQFSVGRGYVRQALKKLEFYGIVQTEPKQGTVVAPLGVKALKGLISTLLQLNLKDLVSFFETRAILETNSAELAAQRATPDDLERLAQKHNDFLNTVQEGCRGLEEDHLFHLCIAEISRNSVLGSLIGLITPDIIQLNRNAENTGTPSRQETVTEHREILESIEEHDAPRARAAMSIHMEKARKRRLSALQKNQRFHDI